MWWRRWPLANIAIATGRGLYVIDVDEDRGGDAGPLALPPALQVKTPHGRHYYFRLPLGLTLRNTTGVLGPHVDTRGDGGYVVGPGSVVNGMGYVEEGVPW
jgi:Bifunctional DNA primase/polymerase, N-terminal